MNVEEVFFTASAPRLSPVSMAVPASVGRKQHQDRHPQEHEEWPQQHESHQQVISREHEEDQPQQQLEVHEEAQQHQPLHSNNKHGQSEREENLFDTQQQKECQPEQALVMEQVQHALPHIQRAIPAKRQLNKTASLPRGAINRRRSRRVASVRFDVPPSPRSEGDAASPPSYVNSPISLRPSAAASFFPATTATADAERDARSHLSWARPVPISNSAEATPSIVEEGADQRGKTTGKDAAADSNVVTGGTHTKDGNQRTGATDFRADGAAQETRAGEFSQSTAHASCQANSERRRESKGSPNVSYGYAVDKFSSSLAGAGTVARKEGNWSTNPAGAGDACEEEPSSSEKIVAQAAPADRDISACASGECRDGGSDAAAIPGIGRASCTVPEQVSDTNDEETLFPSRPDWTGGNFAAAYCGGRRMREGRAAKDRPDGWRRGAGFNYHKSSESSLSSSWSDKERCDDEQQQDGRRKKGNAGYRLSRELEQADACVPAVLKTSHLFSQAAGHSPINPAATVPDNTLPADNDVDSNVDMAAAIHAAALEAALAIDAAAAAAYPTEIGFEPDDKAAAAARRRGKAHILMSTTSTQHSRHTLTSGRISASPAVANRISCGTSLSAAEKADFTNSPTNTTTGRCHVVAALSRPSLSDRRPSLPQATQDDTTQSAEDALEYSSDWSVFRRSTGRCNIVNPGAAVSFTKTTTGVWRNVGTSASYTSSRSRGAHQLSGSSTSGSLIQGLSVENISQHVARNVTVPPAIVRSYYLNAAAVRAAATADAAAYQGDGRSLTTRKREIVRTVSGRRSGPTSSDMQQERRFHSNSQEKVHHQVYERAVADVQETASLPGTARHSTGGRHLLSWWWGRRTQEQQQLPGPLPQSSAKAMIQRRHALEQQHLPEQRQQSAQSQDQELLPLPSRKQRWSILLPADTTAVDTAGTPIRNGSNSSNTEDATELEQLLQLEGESTVRTKPTEGDDLQKEDLEAIVCNIQQVKNFLVKKLRECEAALLATARERDNMEISLKELGRTMQEKEQQRDAAAKQLQTENLKQANELKRLQEELTSLRERATAQEQQIQQLQDEGVLLRADVHDRVAASVVEHESLLSVIKQLEMDKATLEEQAQQLQQALAKSRQQLASALSRVDELEAFVPPASRGEIPPSGSSGSSSSRRSSSTSPTTRASTATVESLRPAWWSRSGRESPQRLLLQRPWLLQQQQRSQQQQQRSQQQQQRSQQRSQQQLQQVHQHAPVAVSSGREVESKSSGTNDSEPRKCISGQALRSLPESTFDSEDAAKRGTIASPVLPPSLSAPLGEVRKNQEGMQHGQQQQKRIQELTTSRTTANILPLQLPAAADAVTRRRSSSSYMPQDDGTNEVSNGDSDAANIVKRDDVKHTHRRQEGGMLNAKSCTTTVTADASGQLEDSSSEAHIGDPRRDATESGGAAEKIKGALTGGVTRMLQQLEQVLTIEERLIIDETGVYTEDGVYLHKSGDLQPSATAGSYACLTSPEQRRVQEATQQQLKTKKQQVSQQLQAKKGSNGDSERVQTDQGNGEEEEQRFTPWHGKKQEKSGRAVRSHLHGSTERPLREGGLLNQRSNSSGDPERRQRLQREEAGGAIASSNEDLLVILSDAEGSHTKEAEEIRSTSSASARGGAGRGNVVAVASSPNAGGAVRGNQPARTERQLQETVKPDGKGSSASHRLSRSSSAASVGDTVRDAFCSVLQAVHQRAVEVYIHPSSVLPTGPGTGNSAKSSMQLAESGLFSSTAGGSAGDAAATAGEPSTERHRIQQQQQQMPQRNTAGCQQAKSGRGRGSAWQQLLQRHREAQQMPLFGSTPYPAATMSSTSRHTGSTSSTSNDNHKSNIFREGCNAASSSVDSSTDSESATAAGARSCTIRSSVDSENMTAVDVCSRTLCQQQATQMQHVPPQQKHVIKQNAPVTPGERVQAPQERLDDTQDQEQALVLAQQRESVQQLNSTQQQGSPQLQESAQLQISGDDQRCEQGQLPPFHEKPFPGHQQIDDQRPTCGGEAVLRDAGELLRAEQGEATEQESAEEAVTVTREAQQEQVIIARSGAEEPQVAYEVQQQPGGGPVEALLHQETEGQQLQRDEEQQEIKGVEEEWRQQQREMTQAPEKETARQQGSLLKKEGKQLEVGDVNLGQEQRSISREEQRRGDHVVGQRNCETAQQDDVHSDDACAQQQEGSEGQESTRQVDIPEQEEQMKPQRQLTTEKQHENKLSQPVCRKVTDTELRDTTGIQASQQQDPHEEEEASPPQEAQHQSVQSRLNVRERVEKKEQKTAQESQQKSEERQPQETGKQQPRPQPKAAQQRAKQPGQRKGGNNKGSGRQRRK